MAIEMQMMMNQATNGNEVVQIPAGTNGPEVVQILTGTNGPEVVQLSAGTNGPEVVQIPAGTNGPEVVQIPAGSNRPEVVQISMGTNGPEVVQIPARTNGHEGMQIPTGTNEPEVVQIPVVSLYVGDLEENVTDSQVYELFSQVGQVVSVRVCRDAATRRSLGYAYVNYTNAADAAKALELLNFTLLNNRSVRIMHSNRDPTARKIGAGNIFIKNLDKTIEQKGLHKTFSSFGTILSCKIMTDQFGQSKGYGFVQYETEESAQKAISQLNGMLLNDKPVFVGPFLRKEDRENLPDKSKFNNVFVKNLSETTTKEDLLEVFGGFGIITSAVVMLDNEGKSKCFGFVNFEKSDDAVKAVEGLNGKKFDNKEWYVGKAQKKAERESELKAKFEKKADKYQGSNLYLKNLDDTIGDEQLQQLFQEFGTITSCKVMCNQNGMSKGSGFVDFSTLEEASKAQREMNGKLVCGKPLYVAFAKRKDDRKAKLQVQFAQRGPVALTPPPVGPRGPLYPPANPSPGQQIFYGHPPLPLMDPQVGYRYGQQMMRPMQPNYLMQWQGPQGPRPTHRPMLQNPSMPILRAPVYNNRYLDGRNILPAYDVVASAIYQPLPIATLSSALANTNTDQQRMMLGERLYPLVEKIEKEQAAKVTGMLLEMDQTDVLHLLESPESLKFKVREAIEVLCKVSTQQQSPNNKEENVPVQQCTNDHDDSNVPPDEMLLSPSCRKYLCQIKFWTN